MVVVDLLEQREKYLLLLWGKDACQRCVGLTKNRVGVLKNWGSQWGDRQMLKPSVPEIHIHSEKTAGSQLQYIAGHAGFGHTALDRHVPGGVLGWILGQKQQNSDLWGGELPLFCTFFHQTVEESIAPAQK